MAYFKSKTPKRTTVWSTRPEIRKFWLGRLTKKLREKLRRKNPNFKSTIKYVDKDGRKRYFGSKQLKSTGSLEKYSNYVCHFFWISWSPLYNISILYCPPEGLGLGLRTYTKAFAFHMTRILKPKRIDPKPSSADPAQQLLNLWHQSEGLGDRWVDAGLPGLAHYVLGARGLKVPPQFESMIPTRI